MSWPVILNIFKAVLLAQFITLFIVLSVVCFEERLLSLCGLEVVKGVLLLEEVF